MKPFVLIQSLAIGMACLGILCPQAAFAVSSAPSHLPDIALHPGGMLVGQVVDAQGAPRIGTPVSIQRNGVEVACAITDAQGRFAVNGLHGGVFHLATANGQAIYRVWAEGTAPPVAQSVALLVSGDIVRGQCDTCGTDPCGCGCGYGCGGMFGGGWLSNPWVLSAIVATAIAVPIAVHDHDSGS